MDSEIPAEFSIGSTIVTLHAYSGAGCCTSYVIDNLPIPPRKRMITGDGGTYARERDRGTRVGESPLPFPGCIENERLNSLLHGRSAGTRLARNGIWTDPESICILPGLPSRLTSFSPSLSRSTPSWIWEQVPASSRAIPHLDYENTIPLNFSLSRPCPGCRRQAPGFHQGRNGIGHRRRNQRIHFCPADDQRGPALRQHGPGIDSVLGQFPGRHPYQPGSADPFLRYAPPGFRMESRSTWSQPKNNLPAMRESIPCSFCYPSVSACLPRTWKPAISWGKSLCLPAESSFQSERNILSIALGGQQVGVWSNLGVSTLLYPDANGSLNTFLSDRVSASDFMGKIKKESVLGVDARVNLLTIGFWSGEQFYTIDFNVRSLNAASVPRDVFAFLKDDQSRGNYDFSGIGFRAKEMVEAAFGWSRNYDNVFNIGFRVKALVGLAEAEIFADNMKVSMGADAMVRPGQELFACLLPSPEIQSHRRRVSGSESISLNGGNFKPGGYGAAVDLGASWNVLPPDPFGVDPGSGCHPVEPRGPGRFP